MSQLRDELDLLDRETTAAVLRVEPRTLDDWRRREIGPPWLRIGGRVFYRRSSIQRWLEHIEEAPADLRSSLAAGGWRLAAEAARLAAEERSGSAVADRPATGPPSLKT